MLLYFFSRDIKIICIFHIYLHIYTHTRTQITCSRLKNVNIVNIAYQYKSVFIRNHWRIKGGGGVGESEFGFPNLF